MAPIPYTMTRVAMPPSCEWTLTCVACGKTQTWWAQRECVQALTCFRCDGQLKVKRVRGKA